MQKYTYVLLDEFSHLHGYYCYSLEELTDYFITTWRQLIHRIDVIDGRCKYADSIRNFAEPVTGNLGEIPYSVTHIPLLTLD